MRKLAGPGLLTAVLLGAFPIAGSAEEPQASSAPDAKAPQMVCMKITLQCFEPAPAASAPALDLSAPDVRKLIPTREFQIMMAHDPDEELPESVKIEGRPPPPNVPPGFAGLWWALKNPTQAWRLFAPVQ